MRTKALIVPGLAAIVVLVVALALGSKTGGVSGASSRATVTGTAGADTIKNYVFAPKSLTVKVGTRVTWTNRDATAHTATADSGSFDTGTINPGQSKTVDFKHPGTFTYHCSFHAFMTATITVTG